MVAVTPGIHRRRYVAGFIGLLLLFCMRVAAQLWQSISPTTALPAFDTWQSGLLPYPVLVASQALIIAVCVAFAVGAARGKVNPNVRWGRVLGVLGAIYFAGAAFRLIAGVTFLSHVSFFAASLPAFFHVVLAGMVLVAAGFHLQGARRAGGPAA